MNHLRSFAYICFYLRSKKLILGFLQEVYSLLPVETITIAGKDGDDAKPYLEKEVNQKLAKLKLIQEPEKE